MDSSKIALLYNTLRYLKPIQWLFRAKQLYHRLFPLKLDRSNLKKIESQNLDWEDSISFPISFKKNNRFSFLNLEQEFKTKIDWNCLEYGRLWTYNLNYFEYLGQRNMTKGEGLLLIKDYISQLEYCKVGLEPYPLSLRCFNWIRFFVRHHVNDEQCNIVLYQQLVMLTHKLEYHLLGNHLLENAFSLLFGAYYFNDSKLYSIAKKILVEELDEQILKDGGHFERSPMYHCTMLFRLLDCYNLIQSNTLFNQELRFLFKQKSMKMLGWLKSMIFNDGSIPLLNDAAFSIAPNPQELFDYAEHLGLITSGLILSDSGYRKLETSKFESIINIAKVGPDYQPGHAHADTFTFELHINNRPVVVDTGTSSYEINETRFYERSTAAHNTVVIDGLNSSQVWAGHRVGKRAYVTILEERKNKFIAVHDGYKSKNLIHKRSFEMKDVNYIITDTVDSEAVAYLHFYPSEKIELSNNEICGTDFTITFRGACSIEKFTSYYASEFNKKTDSVSLRIKFNGKLETIFK